MLPNFIVIGAQKSGTTSIFAQLKEHPQVFMPVKEMLFFGDDEVYSRGIDYYASLFAEWRGEKAVGEATPNYLSSPVAAERMTKHLPAVRLIASLRDPIERAYSAFRMQVFNGAEAPDASFVEAVNRIPGYLDVGRYSEHLTRYYQLFPPEQLLITWFEELSKRPERVYERICDFLEIEPIDFGNVPVHVALRGLQPPTTLGMRTVRIMRKGFELIDVGPFRQILRRQRVYRAWYGIRDMLRPRRTGIIGYPPLKPEHRAQLIPLVRDDILRLQDMTGTDLSNWLSP